MDRTGLKKGKEVSTDGTLGRGFDPPGLQDFLGALPRLAFSRGVRDDKVVFRLCNAA